jgi:CarboxypepD_reg-like domain
MEMRVSPRVIVCPVLLMILLPAFVFAVLPQSGRSWMNGFIFADSNTQGLAANVELIGDQSNDRLKSVHLSTKADMDGSYSIKDIPYGDYTFRVTAEGYAKYEIKLYIGSDMLTQIHVKLKRKR